VRSGLLQRKCACGGTPGPTGKCEECRKKKLRLQTKFRVNEPGDIYEQEADRIADQVIATPAHTRVSSAPPDIQRFSGQPSGVMDVAPASVDQALATPGTPLEPALRRDMERSFGHDFSRVRIHSDTAAKQSASKLNAHAYTVGDNIVFGASSFAPGTQEGRRLIAHELTHVVQQNDFSLGRPARATFGLAAERSQCAFGETAAFVSLRAPGPRIQRQLVPPEEFVKRISEIDAKLADPNLPDDERIKLLQQRHEDWEYLSHAFGIPKSARFALPESKLPSSPSPSGTSSKPKPVLTSGGQGNKRASVMANAKLEAKKGSVRPPSTPYVNTNPEPENEQAKDKWAEEAAIGKRLNEIAISNKLDQIGRVEGRQPVPPDTADYAFIGKDGSEIKADLYSPEANKIAEDAALQAIKKKSAQGEILVLHLRGVERPLEYAQRVAEALIVTPNHRLKRLIVFDNYKFLINRSLAVSEKALTKIKHVVASRMEERRKTEQVKQQVQEKPKTEARIPDTSKWSPKDFARVSSNLAAFEIGKRFGEPSKSKESSKRLSKGLFYDPAARTFEKPSGTGMTSQGAWEGAWQMAYAGQIDSIRNVEREKAFGALKALQQQIAELQAQGRDVQVVVVTEVPIAFDLLAEPTGVPAPDQIVYFTRMYISQAPFARRPGAQVKPSESTAPMAKPTGVPAPDQMWAPSAAEVAVSESLEGHEDRYQEPEWIKIMQQRYEMGLPGTYKPPRKGFRFEVGNTVFPAWGN
jgi:hypothetical protein